MSGLLREIETTFVIRTQRSEEIARRIADLRSLGSYSLVPRRTLTLHDRYFDTPDRRLQAAKFALRTRAIGAGLFITLKGDVRPGSHGGQDRLEIEEPLSEKTFLTLAQEIRHRGVALDLQSGGGPDIMQRAGLQIIQERKTLRQIRDVTGANHRSLLAEMAVDFVQYLLARRRICFHEIEIEAKSEKEEGQRAMKAVSDELLKKFPAALLPWPHSKLATGNAIGHILSGDPQWDPGNSNDLLGPDAFDRIAATIHQGYA
jgi:inorganic triphosphatase YgiF